MVHNSNDLSMQGDSVGIRIFIHLYVGLRRDVVDSNENRYSTVKYKTFIFKLPTGRLFLRSISTVRLRVLNFSVSKIMENLH